MTERIWQELNPAQADGLACVACAADYLTVTSPHTPVGRSPSGSQVFACQDGCVERVAQDEDLARWATVLSVLAEGHLLIGGLPRQGKSAAIRALMLQAALEADQAPDRAGREETGGEPR